MRFVRVDGKKRPLHRVLVEERLGRKLRADEIVRHLDGDPLNNDEENLIVVSWQEHFELSMTAQSKQPWTDQEVNRAIELYRAGSSIDQVARELGRSYHATRRLLSKWIWLRTPHETTALKKARAGASSARFSSPELPSKPTRSGGENPAPGLKEKLSDEAARQKERLRRLRASDGAGGEDRLPEHSTGRSSAPLIEIFVRSLTAEGGGGREPA